jgi:two-component system OmpR family sensor kinase
MSRKSASGFGWLAWVPLRITLVVGLVLLMAGTLVATGYAATSALRGYLMNRLDDQVQRSSVEASRVAMDPTALPLVNGGVFNAVSGLDQMYIAVTDADGRMADDADAPGADQPDLSPNEIAALAGADDAPTTVDSADGDSRWRVMVTPVDTDRLMVVAMSMADVDATVGRLRTINLVVGLVALLGLGIAGYYVIRSSLRPLASMEDTAVAIAAGNLDRRIPYQNPRTEVGRLGMALNGMLTQIESAFGAQRASEAAARASEDRMRQFVADAGHELRTPLTSIRGYAELFRQGAVDTVGGRAQVVRRIEDAAASMGMLVDDLLLLARLDQHRPLARRPVDMLQLATDTAHDARARAPERSVEVRSADGPVPPVAIGDEDRLRQVVGNLVGNALTHTPPDADVTLSVGSQAADQQASNHGPRRVWLEVRDSGPGLAPSQLHRVFERFYRGDESRSRDSGGIGLGLSIVASIVDAHGGTVAVSSRPGAGACFRVELPAADLHDPYG